ncbi:uncharacterized protein T551_02252 [Pneumocystis jirovecii RU7]|uniref:Uncharacterized protein n=1 Tax=Pneumocystis jirovecii (strain RU7) TaxID=1408657 RepID=A0A0W4ZMN6_PNEJ7|nr:uncharacterized protein T551_02252 [Pneumocystis jirovecii RU7]KTW29636.1 hypothetical protein T551_02252 [Pneumocystis jirovecii RU7]
MDPGNYYQLLRGSRLVALPQAIGKRTSEKYYPTHQIIKSPPSSHFRGNWGLKRDMPQIRASYISIDSLDTLQHQTPFESGNNKFNFLQRWKEMRIHLYTTKLINNNKKEEKDLKNTLKTPISPFVPVKISKKNALHKNISDMSFKEFKKYIQKLKAKKEHFIQFVIQQQKESLFEYQQTKLPHFSKSIGLQKTYFLINKYIGDFLNIPENNQKVQKTLPNSGLDYCTDGYLSPIVEFRSRNRSFPARILSKKPDDKKVLFGGIVAYVLGKNTIPKSINGIKEIREGIVPVVPKFAQISPEGKLQVYVTFLDSIKDCKSSKC